MPGAPWQNKPVDGVRSPPARFFKISSIFALLPFIFQLPPTKNFLSIVDCCAKVQIARKRSTTRRTDVDRFSLKGLVVTLPLSAGSDQTPASHRGSFTAGIATRYSELAGSGLPLHNFSLKVHWAMLWIQNSLRKNSPKEGTDFKMQMTTPRRFFKPLRE